MRVLFVAGVVATASLASVRAAPPSAGAGQFDPQCLGKKKHGYQKREVQKMKVSSGNYITMVRGDVDFPDSQGGGRDDAVVITFPEGGTFVRRIRDLLGTQRETFIYDNRYFEIFKNQGRFMFFEISDAGHLKRARKRETRKQQDGSRHAFDADWDSPALAHLKGELAGEFPECVKTGPRGDSGEGENADAQPGVGPDDPPAPLEDPEVRQASEPQVCGTCKVNGDLIDAALADNGKTVVCGPGSMSSSFARRAFCDPRSGGWQIVNPYVVYAATLKDTGGAGDITSDCKAYLLKYAEVHKDHAVPKPGDPDAPSWIDSGARLSSFAAGGCYENLFSEGKLTELRTGLGGVIANDPEGANYCMHVVGGVTPTSGSGSGGRSRSRPPASGASSSSAAAEPGGPSHQLASASFSYTSSDGRTRGGSTIQVADSCNSADIEQIQRILGAFSKKCSESGGSPTFVRAKPVECVGSSSGSKDYAFPASTPDGEVRFFRETDTSRLDAEYCKPAPAARAPASASSSSSSTRDPAEPPRPPAGARVLY